MKSRWLRYTLVVMVSLAFMAGGMSALAASKKEAEKKLVFGMCVKWVGVPYINAAIQGAQARADELGVKLLIKDGEADTLKILYMIDTFIVQGIDGFIMAGATDLKAVVPGIKKLNEAGIPITAIDTCPQGGKIDMFISFDIEKATMKATKLLVDGIKKRNGGVVPKGTVIEIIGDLRDMFAVSACKGFAAVMDQYPQIKRIQGEGLWNNDDAHNRTSDLLTRSSGENVLAIYCQTPDIMGSGVVSAIEARGLDPKDFGVTGICIAPEGLELIKSGKILGIVEQPILVSGELAVQYLYDIKTGKEIPKPGDVVRVKNAIWAPASVMKNPWSDEGVYMELQDPLVPQEIGPDDPRLWENQLK